MKWIIFDRQYLGMNYDCMLNNVDLGKLGRKYSCPLSLDFKHYKKKLSKVDENGLSSSDSSYENSLIDQLDSDLYPFQTVNQFNEPEEDVSTDKVDGTNSNIIVSSGDTKSFPWNQTYIDVETTRIMLSSLDDHIKNTKDKIFKELSVKDGAC